MCLRMDKPLATPTRLAERWSRLRQRFDAHYQLALVVFFAAFTAVGIVPFAVYRFATGATFAGFLDSALVLAMLSVVIVALRTGDARGPGRVLMLINTTGAVASATLLGEVGLFWMYAVQMTNYFLVSHRIAAVVSITALAILVVHGSAFDSNAEMLSFLVTSLLVGLLSYVLSSRTDGQRRQLELLATLDPLTGAHNRRAMEVELAIAVEARRRGGAPTGLVIFDIDHFKRVNDNHGHEAGDQTLIAVAREARAGTRSVDRVFRMGGEEFVVLLPNTHGVALETAAEHLRERIETNVGNAAGTITISLGCAVHSSGESWQAWLARADAALFRAKQSGRNLVAMA